MRRHRRISMRAAALGGALCALVPAFSAAAGGAVDLEPGHLPSFLYDNYRTQASSESTAVFTDPSGTTLFEVGGVMDSCAWAASPQDTAAYDIAGGGVPKAPSASACVGAATGGQSYYPENDSPLVAVDPVDGVLVLQAQTTNGPGLPATLDVLDEKTLQVVGTITLPLGSPSIVTGLRWSPADDGVLVVASNFPSDPSSAPENNIALPTLLEYRGADLRHAASTSVSPAWAYLVPPPCMVSSEGAMATASPYRSEVSPDIFLACLGPSSVVVTQHEYDFEYRPLEIMDLRLDAYGVPLPSTTLGAFVATEAPLHSTDFLFDTHTNRGYVLDPCCLGVNPLTAYVYDGAVHSVVEQAAMSQGTGPDKVATALDDVTGRLYVFSASGLGELDAAAKPNAPSQLFPSPTTSLFHWAMQVPVLQPDAGHPYPRIVAPQQMYDPTGANCAPMFRSFCVYVPYVNVYDDRLG